MSTRIAKEDMARMMPNSIGHYFNDAEVEMPAVESSRPGLFARIAKAVSYVLEIPHRRAVMNELYSLSPHELADIGLTRAELPMVFDADFVASRLGGNRSNPQARAASRSFYAA
jgi:uncharacterized protein YjiS (DUF1127 family)